MKRKLIQLIGFGLIFWLIIGLTLDIAACSSAATTSMLKAIQISPNPSPNLAAGLSQYFYAVGKYSDGSSQDIGNEVNWVSSDTRVATINPSGSVTAVAVGTTNISATFSGITSPTVILTVVPATSTTTIIPKTVP